MVSKIRVGLIGVLLMVGQQASIYAFTSVSPSLKLEFLMIPISSLVWGSLRALLTPLGPSYPQKSKEARMAVKKKVKSKVKSREVPVLISDRKSVNINKASNGYVISSYTDTGEKTFIAKTKSEAKKYADKLLGL